MEEPVEYNAGKKEEERIVILSTNKNGECKAVLQDGCHVSDSCQLCNVGMTRSEALKKMSEGIAKYKNKGGLFCDGYAEAALDALLN